MRAAVLGSPVSHSLSPVLHTAAYLALGLAGWSYQAIECDEAALPALLDSRTAGWAGLSLTMPLKRAVLPLLDHADPLVTSTGCANTVIWRGGARHGYNTDVPGLSTALAAAGVTAWPALILGGGATACSALAALRGLGANSATVAVRNRASTGGLLAAADALGMRVELTAFGAAGDQAGVQLMISTVPGTAADIYAERMHPPAVVPAAVFDVVYHPWPTALAAAARKAGAVVVSGFDLLLHQAARQVELMTGQAAPVQAMRLAGLAELDRRGAVGGRAGPRP